MTQQTVSSSVYVVADLGGTTLRLGRVVGGQLETDSIRRVATENLRLHPDDSACVLQRRVMSQLIDALRTYLRSPIGIGASAVGLSFAGPLTRDGVAVAAPTIWGHGAAPLCIYQVLQKALDLPVFVANDITAAAWRYMASESQSFCLFTVSSGIGNKVFWRGDVLVSDEGHGGELGHWRVDHSPDAPRCDCGGQGHLGAIASGRGVVALACRMAAQQSREFAYSMLFKPAGGRPDAITSIALAAAVRSEDAFALGVMREALKPLASAVSCLFAAIGIRRYLFIGGFANAVGQAFITMLGDELVRFGCFGLNEEEMRGMLCLGAPDDDHSLIGIGHMVSAFMANTLQSSITKESWHACAH